MSTSTASQTLTRPTSRATTRAAARRTPPRSQTSRAGAAPCRSARPTLDSATDRRSTSRGSAGVPVHLTRRGRLLVLAALVALLLATFSLGRAASLASPRLTTTAPATSASLAEQVTVQPGESLWSVASRIAPGQDPREVVAQIRRLNDLSTAQLRPGQHLLLPVAA